MSGITSKSTVLITGGAGFIGTTLARKLAGTCRIALFDNLSRNAIAQNLKGVENSYELHQGDVTVASDVSSVIEKVKPDFIVHAAGVAGIDSVGRAPVRTIEVNFLGTANVLRSCLDLPNLQRVVTFSTSEIYGSSALQPDEFAPAVIGAVGEPRWVYAVSKLASEHLSFAYYHQHKLPATLLRPFNVYGPGQVGEGALREFIRRSITGQPIDLHNDGTQIRSWCYVDDMVQGIMLSLEKPDAIGKAFNIGNPRATETMLRLAQTVKRITNSNSEIRHVKRDQADIALRIPDIRYTEKHLGYAPTVDLEDGISRTVAFMRAEIESAKV